MTQGARSLTGLNTDVYWFEGTGYLYTVGAGHDADGVVGNVFSQSSGGCITNHGLNYRSVLGRQENLTFNPDYGIHGATNSPLRVLGDDIYMISGFGSFWNASSRETNGGLTDASQITNWQLIRYSQNLVMRIPILVSNNRNGWDIVSEMARITNSIVGFHRGQLFFRPRTPITATLSASLGISDTTMTYANGDAPLPTSGLILIDDELIEFQFS